MNSLGCGKAEAIRTSLRVYAAILKGIPRDLSRGPQEEEK